jgi:hypothetical protein
MDEIHVMWFFVIIACHILGFWMEETASGMEDSCECFVYIVQFKLWSSLV